MCHLQEATSVQLSPYPALAWPLLCLWAPRAPWFQSSPFLRRSQGLPVWCLPSPEWHWARCLLWGKCHAPHVQMRKPGLTGTPMLIQIPQISQNAKAPSLCHLRAKDTPTTLLLPWLKTLRCTRAITNPVWQDELRSGRMKRCDQATQPGRKAVNFSLTPSSSASQSSALTRPSLQPNPG